MRCCLMLFLVVFALSLNAGQSTVRGIDGLDKEGRSDLALKVADLHLLYTSEEKVYERIQSLLILSVLSAESSNTARAFALANEARSIFNWYFSSQRKRRKIRDYRRIRDSINLVTYDIRRLEFRDKQGEDSF